MNLEKEVFDIALTDILPNRFQPREKFDDQELNELALSIREHGVIQPIIVRKIGDKYEIVAGERRFRASQVAGKTTIPALIRNIDDKESAKIALLENLQRKNLTPIEEARTYQTILKLDNLTQEELANNLGKSQSAVANKLRLLNLIPEAQDALLHEKISERHARSLLNLTDPIKQKEELDKVILNRMTVKQLDDEISLITGTPIISQLEEDNSINTNYMNNFISNEVITNSKIDLPTELISQETSEMPIIEEQANMPKRNLLKENKPSVNRNIFDGLRRENMVVNPINTYVAPEVTPIEEPIQKKNYDIEETYVPSTEEIKQAPKEGIAPTPKYDGPKYDFPDINIEQPLPYSNQTFNTYDQIEALLDNNSKEPNSYEMPNIPEEQVTIETPQAPISATTNSFSSTNDIYDMRFAINNFRQAVQNTEKFGFNIETEEFDFDNIYQIVIKIDKNKKTS